MRWRSVALRTLVLLAAIGVIGAGLWFGVASGRPDVAGSVTVARRDAAASALQGPWPATVSPTQITAYEVADAIVPKVPLFAGPDQPLDGRVMANPTWEGLPVVFLVHEDAGNWLHVSISSRPNGSTAWVRKSDVSIRAVPNRMLVELAAHRVTVFHGDDVLLREPAAIGSPDAPTPTGDFFVDGVVKTDNPEGAYGAYQVSVSGFSDVYDHFAGGVGQIALHGTNQPELLGQGVSHGCVRLTNDAITRVVGLAPTGTPVKIVV